MGPVFLTANRNKRSLMLDLKQPAARAALLKLARDADVFFHSMRPQAIRRLDLAYADVVQVNPRIVYCGAYGFGEAGPYGHKPAYDDMIQAISGLAALVGHLDGTPRYVPATVADKVVGLTAVQAILAALFHRERTGEGQAIEVPMFETMVAFNLLEHLYGQAFEPPKGTTGYVRVLSPGRRPYATKDGYMGVLPWTDRQWAGFFEATGRQDLADDPRFPDIETRLANIDSIYAEIAEIVATRTTAEWLEAFDAAHVPAVPVNALEDLLDDPHLKAVGFWRLEDHPTEGMLRDMATPVRFSKSPDGAGHPAPRLGQHSREVLREAGLAEADIAHMVETGATGGPEAP